jgi:hypothetical protein
MFPRKSQFLPIKAPQNERFTKSNDKYNTYAITKNNNNTKHKNNEQ